MLEHFFFPYSWWATKCTRIMTNSHYTQSMLVVLMLPQTDVIAGSSQPKNPHSILQFHRGLNVGQIYQPADLYANHLIFWFSICSVRTDNINFYCAKHFPNMLKVIKILNWIIKQNVCWAFSAVPSNAISAIFGIFRWDFFPKKNDTIGFKKLNWINMCRKNPQYIIGRYRRDHAEPYVTGVRLFIWKI